MGTVLAPRQCIHLLAVLIIMLERKNSKTFNKRIWWWLKPSGKQSHHSQEISGETTLNNMRNLKVSSIGEEMLVSQITSLIIKKSCFPFCNSPNLQVEQVTGKCYSIHFLNSSSKEPIVEAILLTLWCSNEVRTLLIRRVASRTRLGLNFLTLKTIQGLWTLVRTPILLAQARKMLRMIVPIWSIRLFKWTSQWKI